MTRNRWGNRLGSSWILACESPGWLVFCPLAYASRRAVWQCDCSARRTIPSLKQGVRRPCGTLGCLFTNEMIQGSTFLIVLADGGWGCAAVFPLGLTVGALFCGGLGGRVSRPPPLKPQGPDRIPPDLPCLTRKFLVVLVSGRIF